MLNKLIFFIIYRIEGEKDEEWIEDENEESAGLENGNYFMYMNFLVTINYVVPRKKIFIKFAECQCPKNFTITVIFYITFLYSLQYF